nr:hypothetical protein [uncultured Albidiferax sp.]
MSTRSMVLKSLVLAGVLAGIAQVAVADTAPSQPVVCGAGTSSASTGGTFCIPTHNGTSSSSRYAGSR